jgi:two-component system CheB/CheR fusion protein
MARKKAPSSKTARGSDAILEPPGTDIEVVNAGVEPAAEQATPDASHAFPIVAIGASAGGIEAFTSLLKALPTDTGMAFVIIQHLSPTHESILSGILGRATKMPVAEITHDAAVEPNRVYVIPPNHSLALAEGRLQLLARTEVRGQARPIDHFMRSLAAEHGHKSIGVVLSGTASDGTLGLEEIKAAGGITFAQDVTAEQASMPRSAIAAGAVDFVLPPDEIARELGRIARHPYVAPTLEPDRESEPAFVRILDILRQATGVDFGNYKRNTLHRRITRRMVLHKLDNYREYLRLLDADPVEVQALYQDVLISVTSFFRNPDAYDALKATVFPRLTDGLGLADAVRVWVLGCSTGEEAYSIAMAFTEYLETSGRQAALQVFATDLNGAAIDKARSGLYGKAIAHDVSPERLRRFFVEVDGSYRVAKQIRDMCVFARQNVLADPPFSRLDLVTCRNMLIYMEPVLQQRLIPLLHYALRDGGYLWLGGSETIGAHRDLFDLADSKHKIYAKKPRGGRAHVQIPVTAPNRWTAQEARARVPEPRGFDPQREADRVLLTRYAPPGVVVNEDLDILQFRGDTSAYLTPAPGKASLNLVRMLREGLLVAVRAAIHRVRREKAAVREEGLRVRSEGGWREVDVAVLPLQGPTPAESGYLLLFEEKAQRIEARARQLDAETRAAAAVPPADATSGREIMRLKQELGATREYLQSVIEQQQAVNEELQAANEEVQSTNEELQSVNEELETSKEELQSANEELATVNDELQSRNLELSHSNNDLTNLLASVQVPIVMLGPDLLIRRFTPPAEKIFNLIGADIGRPISDIKLGVDVDDLETVVLEVIESMSAREREVRGRDGRWHLLRVRPYRTHDNKIEGAVVMLIDIDVVKRSEQSLRESEERFETLANSAPVLIWVDDTDGNRFVNRAYEDFVGQLEADIRRMGHAAFVHPEDRPAFVEAFAAAVRDKRPFDVRLRFRRGDGEHRWMKMKGMPRFASGGELAGMVGCIFDITDLQETEQALRELDRGKNEFLAVLAHELRNPLSGVRNAARLLAESHEEPVTDRAREIIERQTANMVRMIDDLLDVSRITYGKIQLRTETVDLLGLLERALAATGAERDERQQSLVTNLSREPLCVKGDPPRLEQVFANLLANASKFTRHGGRIWLTAERTNATGASKGTAVVRVRDNGVGISPEMLPKVFDLFAQGDKSLARTSGGLGIGLTLVRRLVELHGGEVAADSQGQGRGARFTVTLPLLGTTGRII